MSTVGGPRLSTIPKFTNTYSMDFDGMDDYLDLGTESTVANGGQFTLSFWIKGNSQPIGAKYLFSADYYNLHTFWTIQNTELYWRNINNNYKLLSTNLLDGDWHHILIIWNPDGANSTIRCFTDGTNEVNVSTDWRYGNGGIYEGALRYIGNRGGGTFPGFNGSIDEFAVWNDDQSANVSTIYNGGTPNDLTDLSPDYWLRNGDNGSWKSPQWLIPNNENKDKVSNYSFEFDGVNDYVDLGSGLDIFQYNIGQSYSVSLWYKSTTSTSFDTILNFGINTYKFSLVTGLNGTVSFGAGNSTSIQYIYNWLPTSGAINDGNWHHICIVQDSSSNIVNLTAYVDGSPNGSSPSGTAAFVSSNNRIGNGYYSGFEGVLDEVSLYNYALSASDITDIYNSGEPTTISGAVAHYKMGEEANFTSNWLVDNSALDNYSKRSFSFDGVDDWINCGEISPLFKYFPIGTASSNPWSASMWVKGSGSSKGFFEIPYTQVNSLYARSFAFVKGASYLYFGGKYVGIKIKESGTTAYSSTEWNHIVMTFDGVDHTALSSYTLYVGGASVGIALITPNIGDFFTENISIGVAGSDGGNTYYWDGQIDEVSLFDVELSSENVSAIYNSGTPTTLPVTALAHWRMGEDASFNGTNWTVPDQVGTNNGTSDGMMVDALVGEAPNYSGGGISQGMDIEDRVGNAPNSENNTLSINMEREDRVEDTPSTT